MAVALVVVLVVASTGAVTNAGTAANCADFNSGAFVFPPASDLNMMRPVTWTHRSCLREAAVATQGRRRNFKVKTERAPSHHILLDSRRGQEPEGKGAAWQRPSHLQRRQAAAASPRDLIDRLKDLLAGAWMIDPNTRKRIMEEIELRATPIISRSNSLQLSQAFSFFGRVRVKPGKKMLAGLSIR